MTVKARKKASLPFKVTDAAPTCGTAKVVITIKKGARVKKKVVLKVVPVNVKRVCKLTVKLKKGTYTWTVTAVDAAGNVQLKKGSKKLTVK